MLVAKQCFLNRGNVLFSIRKLKSNLLTQGIVLVSLEQVGHCRQQGGHCGCLPQVMETALSLHENAVTAAGGWTSVDL